MSGVLSTSERADFYGAINFWDDDIEDAGWQVIEDIVRKHMAEAWEVGYIAAWERLAPTTRIAPPKPRPNPYSP